MKEADLKPGKYKHYKGNYYQVTGLATHSETLEKLVVYKALYATEGFAEGSLWVRPAKMFLENVLVDGVEAPRFAFVE